MLKGRWTVLVRQLSTVLAQIPYAKYAIILRSLGPGDIVHVIRQCFQINEVAREVIH